MNYYESNSRSVTLNEPGNPLSVKTITDSTSTGNDPHYATTYDAAFRKSLLARALVGGLSP
ncbi:MAG: hypothetical protein M3475_06850 [Actinomycetota bacterium]|nr:hypothetical protein [Actinomycetota bacterium]